MEDGHCSAGAGASLVGYYEKGNRKGDKSGLNIILQWDTYVVRVPELVATVVHAMLIRFHSQAALTLIKGGAEKHMCIA